MTANITIFAEQKRMCLFVIRLLVFYNATNKESQH